MSQALIDATGISFRPGGKTILENIDLRIVPDSITSLIGPNGAGKSSLVKLLLGIYPLHSGRIIRSDKLRVGYMPQKLHIDRTLPLKVGYFMRLSGSYSRAAVEDALGRTGVPDLYNAPMATLSGGETQRVLLARTILSSPDLLVLDEPVQGVDYQGQSQLYQTIREIREELKCAVLMVSHDLHVVMAHTDQVLCLNRHICCSGTPETVAQHPEFHEMFGQVTNIGLYTHHHDHSHH